MKIDSNSPEMKVSDIFEQYGYYPTQDEIAKFVQVLEESNSLIYTSKQIGIYLDNK